MPYAKLPSEIPNEGVKRHSLDMALVRGDCMYDKSKRSHLLDRHHSANEKEEKGPDAV